MNDKLDTLDFVDNLHRFEANDANPSTASNINRAYIDENTLTKLFHALLRAMHAFIVNKVYEKKMVSNFLTGISLF